MNIARHTCLLLALCALMQPLAAQDMARRSDLGPADIAPGKDDAPPPPSPGSSVTLVQRGDNNRARATTRGHASDITLTQTGAGHSATLSATGANSRIAVDQHGTAHAVDIQLLGNNRAIEVRQTGSRRNDTVILY